MTNFVIGLHPSGVEITIRRLPDSDPSDTLGWEWRVHGCTYSPFSFDSDWEPSLAGAKRAAREKAARSAVPVGDKRQWKWTEYEEEPQGEPVC